MAVVAVRELQREGADVNADGSRSYPRKFRVECDNPSRGGAAAIIACPVRRFDVYVETDENGNITFVDERALADEGHATLEERDTSYNYLVVFTYSTAYWDEIERRLASGGAGGTSKPPHSQDSSADSPASPLVRPSVIRAGHWDDKRPLEKDFSDPPKPICNSAGDRFDPPRETVKRYRTITVEKNYAEPNEDLWNSYFNTVNEDAFTLGPYMAFGVGTVKCEFIDWTSEFENGITYFRVVFEFAYRLDGWLFEPMDVGTHIKATDGSGDRLHIIGRDHLPVTSPVKLDGAGNVLTPTDADAKYLSFKEFKTKPFQLLRLP